jgi:spore photoproduct lyase
MIETIYLEAAVAGEPRATRLLARFPEATVIECGHYGEVFNPSAQSFRLQKRRPALIVARKPAGHVLEAPAGFAIEEGPSYYFSHMLNCVYDCRYCFLQGMFRSAHYVLFVNFEDFQHAIDETRARHQGQRCTFFSGYDCDSLALESLTGFVGEFVPFFAQRPDALLELRTKSVAVAPLLRRDPLPNVVTAFSFAPKPAARAVEHGTPPVAARIDALRRLAEAGWPVALRLDPLLWYEGWRGDYRELVDTLAAAIPAAALHSISIGPLRFPRDMFHRIEGLYPDEPLFAGPLRPHDGITSYGTAREAALVDHTRGLLTSAFPDTPLYACTPAA